MAKRKRRNGKNGESITSARILEAARKADRALELRSAGFTLQQIAKECGYKSTGSLHEILVSKLADITKESAEEVFALEVKRLDDLQRGIWDRAVTGDLPAFDRVLRVMERRAALYGLDRVHVEANVVTVNPTADAVAALLATLQAKIGGESSAPPVLSITGRELSAADDDDSGDM
jgi:hypothetical protein